MSERESILVVDDDAGIVQLLKSMLAARGFDVMIATSGKAALEAVAVIRPDAILMDVNLPDMDGLMAAFHLHSASETRGVPIVMMSGDMHQEIMDEAIHLGCLHSLHKPFTMGEMVRVVKEAIAESKRALSA